MKILYVDDGLIFASKEETLELINDTLKTNFIVKVLDLSCFVGLEISKSENCIQICQKSDY